MSERVPRIVAESVRFIMSIAIIASLFVIVPIFGELIQGWIQPDGVVQDSGEPTRDELERAMRYHGVSSAYVDADGTWRFKDVKNRECKLFKDGEK
jgi:hypothetical protein